MKYKIFQIFMKVVLLNIACLFVLIFVLIFGWEMWKTPRVYFDSFSHPTTILKARTTSPPILNLTKEDMVALITEKSVEHGLDPRITVRIARCESSLRPEAKNKYSSARGLYQITLATQKEAEKSMKRKFDVYKPEENIEIAFYFMRKGQWRRWMCK